MHGIGGCTIEEAQRRISYAEFLTWVRFRNKRGTLNPGLRMDRGFALLASLYTNSRLKQGATPYRIYDFAPHLDEPEEGLDRAMETWK